MARVRSLLGSIGRGAQRALRWFEGLRPVWMLTVIAALVLATTASAWSAFGDGGVTVSGYVVDDAYGAGSPIANATVELYYTDSNLLAASTSSDSLGMYTFAEIDSEVSYYISATYPNYWQAPYAMASTTFIYASAGTYTDGPYVYMYPDGYTPDSGGGGGSDPVTPTIYGTVTDSGTTDPIAGALVELILDTYNPDTDTDSYEVAQTMTTGATGQYSFTVPYGETYKVRISAAGYDYKYYANGSTADLSDSIILAEGVVDSCDASVSLVTMQPQISGVVRSAKTGDPVPFAHLNIGRKSATPGYPPTNTVDMRADWDGSYRYYGTIGTEYLMWVDDNTDNGFYYWIWWGNGQAWDMYTDSPTTVLTDEFPVVSTDPLLTPYEITGVATDSSTGSPLDNVTVYLYAETAVDSGVYQAAQYTTTGALGTYTFGPLDSGLGYKIYGGAEGYPGEFQDGSTTEADAAAVRFWDGIRTNWNLETGEPDPVIVTSLALGGTTPAPTTGTIAGTVTAASGGAAVSGATVTLYVYNGSQWVVSGTPATTPANGSYSFTVDLDTAYRVGVAKTGYVTEYYNDVDAIVLGTSLTPTAASPDVTANVGLASSAPAPSTPSSSAVSVDATSGWALALASLAGLALLVRSRRRAGFRSL